jgi:hypothetical protein
MTNNSEIQRICLRLSLILFTILVLTGCGNKESGKSTTGVMVKPYPHTVNMSKGFQNSTQIKLGDIADSIRYIVLSKNKQHLLGRIRNIQMTDSNIYLLSDYLLMRFDLNGKFHNSYGSLGRGPQEYLPGSIFTTTPDDDKIIIFRSAMDSYLTFNPDGNYIKTSDFRVPRTMYDFKSLSDSVFLCTFYYLGTVMKDYIVNSINWIAGIFDQDGNPIKVIEHPLKNADISETETRNIISMAPSVTFFDNRAVIMPEGDTVYEINTNSIFKGYIIDWGNIPHKQSNEELYFRNTESSNKVSVRSPILETCNKTYFRVFRGNDNYIFEYDKVTGSTKSMMEDPDNPGFINDLDGGVNIYPYYNNREGNIWISIEDAYSFKEKHSPEFMDKSVALYPEMKEKLKTFTNNLKQDDNPVLKIVYLRKNSK